MRSITAALALASLLAGTGCADPLPDPRTISPKDSWSGLFTLRDQVTAAPMHPRPAGGWLLSPIHAHLLPTGRALLHGWARDGYGDDGQEPYTLGNDSTWIIDPADERLAGAADRDLPVSVFFPPAQSPADPDGLKRHDDQTMMHEGEMLMCGGHTFLADGVLFYTGGSAFEVDNDPFTLPNPENPGDLIAVGTRRAARFNAADAPVNGARPGWSYLPQSQLGNRYYPTSTRLPDGRVVVSSGLFDTEILPNPSIEVFDPARSTWTPLVDTIEPGEKLPEGDPRLHLYPDAEDYVHAFLLAKPWIPGMPGTPADNKLARQVALLGYNGRVHLLGVDGGTGLDRLYLPKGGRRPGAGADETEPRLVGASCVILPDGRLLCAGGTDMGGYGNRADVYDPRPGSPDFDRWDSMRLCDAGGACTSRYQTQALYMPDGRVALVGGHATSKVDHKAPQAVLDVRAARDERSVAFVDWAARTVAFGAPWPDALPRTQHMVALLLPDGRLLVAGGRRIYCEPSCPDERPDMRLYSPAYLDPALDPFRPRIGPLRDAATDGALGTLGGNPAIPLGAKIRAALSTKAPPAASEAVRFALVALGSVTHRVDQNLRYVPLAREPEGDGAYVLAIPSDAFVLPPGPYMLFAITTVTTGSGPIDLPSPGRIVLVR